MPYLAAAASLALAGSAGILTAVALGGGAPPPTRTVTVNIPTSTGAQGPAGPPGPAGPQGPPGPAGGFDCLTGYSPGILQINAPGGQVSIYTCLKD